VNKFSWIYLPLDDLARVSVRDYAPKFSIVAASLGTSLSVTDGNHGIVAAIGTIQLGNGPLGGLVFNDLGATPGTPSAAAIDALFTDNDQLLGLDLPNDPLGGLALILEHLAALSVDSDGDLSDNNS
jgi:hypothetical protein